MYVKTVSHYEKFEDSYVDSETGATQKFMNDRPVFVQLWETPWQPEHMPVGSVIQVCVGDPEFAHNKPWTATVTGHAYNGPRSIVVITDQPCEVMKKKTGRTVNICHVKHVLSRGTGGVQWERPTLDGQLMPNGKLLDASGKKKTEYCADSVLDLVNILLSTHPAFAYANPNQHMYRPYNLTGSLGKLGRTFYGDGVHGFVVDKKKFKKALHAALVRGKRSRMEAQKKEDKLYEKMYEQDMESMFEDM